MSLLREQMAQMFQVLTQTNVAITAMANQNAVGLPPYVARDPPYEMPYRWNIEAPINEEQEQQNTMNNDGASSHVQKYTRAHHQGSQIAQPFTKWLHAVEGGNRYGLEAVGLCLVPDIGLLADF
ncbi:hypothetical protein CR513_45582, partial [Mucuna pruriens]